MQTAGAGLCKGGGRGEALPVHRDRLHQEENQRGSSLLLWPAPRLENEPGGRPEYAAGSREEASMGDGGGEGKR